MTTQEECLGGGGETIPISEQAYDKWLELLRISLRLTGLLGSFSDHAAPAGCHRPTPPVTFTQTEHLTHTKGDMTSQIKLIYVLFYAFNINTHSKETATVIRILYKEAGNVTATAMAQTSSTVTRQGVHFKPPFLSFLFFFITVYILFFSP